MSILDSQPAWNASNMKKRLVYLQKVKVMF